MPNCFDGCPDKECFRNGYDVEPYKYCSQQPILDHYKKEDVTVKKKPCKTCIHKSFKLICVKCIHNEQNS